MRIDGFVSLSELRGKAGLTEKKIIRKLGINRKTWESWLWGITEPNPDQKDKLAKLLKCPVSMINEAVARNHERWIRQKQSLVIPADGSDSYRKTRGSAAATIIVQIIVSTITSVITVLWLLGKL